MSNWVQTTRMGSLYEEEMDTESDPPRFRHRSIYLTTGEPMLHERWRAGPAPDRARAEDDGDKD